MSATAVPAALSQERDPRDRNLLVGALRQWPKNGCTERNLKDGLGLEWARGTFILLHAIIVLVFWGEREGELWEYFAHVEGWKRSGNAKETCKFPTNSIVLFVIYVGISRFGASRGGPLPPKKFGNPGERLRKKKWDLNELPKFEKNFYVEHPEVARLTPVSFQLLSFHIQQKVSQVEDFVLEQCVIKPSLH